MKTKEEPFWETGINPITGYLVDGLSNTRKNSHIMQERLREEENRKKRWKAILSSASGSKYKQ